MTDVASWTGLGRRTRPTLLAVAGDSASGKSTLTNGLVAAIEGESTSTICVDDYHRYDREERRCVPFTPLHPECNYLNILDQHLQLIAAGEPILKPVYDHACGTLERPVLVEPTDFMIVEGLFPLHSSTSRGCFDLAVYLDPPEELRHVWKVQRDVRDRGYTEAQVRADLITREPDSAAHIRPQRGYADIVVRFAPDDESADESDRLSASILVRAPAHDAQLARLVAAHPSVALEPSRDERGSPVTELRIHGRASRTEARRIEDGIWTATGLDAPLPSAIGRVGTRRSHVLATVQLILVLHLVFARRSRTADVRALV